MLLAHGANRYGLVRDIEVVDHGLVYAPEMLGLGYEIDRQMVEREKVEEVK